jgi:hypothetical protein
MVGIENAIIARCFVGFDRSRRARFIAMRLIQIPIQQSGTQSLLSVALVIAVVIFCNYLAVL